MNKIHVDTTALHKKDAAILVVPKDSPPWPAEIFVQIHCPSCGAKSATVEQHNNTAHVIVPRIEQIKKKDEPHDP